MGFLMFIDFTEQKIKFLFLFKLNQRLENSLSNDPNLRITVNLVDVLILNVILILKYL
jgi:hypothetical protein